MSVRIAPSILSADFAKLGEAVAAVERGGADLIHVDVMDGHFVPNITIGPPVVKSLQKVVTVPMDVHLMIRSPIGISRHSPTRAPSMMSVHVEVLRHLHRTVHAIKALNVKAGVVINPATPALLLQDIAADVDFVLVMSVNPGFGGQTFIPHSESKSPRGARAARRGEESGAGRDGRRHRPEDRRARRGGGRAHSRGRLGDLPQPRPRARHARVEGRRARRRRASGSMSAERRSNPPPGSACATPRRTRWASSTTRTTSSGSRSGARTCCATPDGITARWRPTGSRCRSSTRSAGTASPRGTTMSSRVRTTGGDALSDSCAVQL